MRASAYTDRLGFRFILLVLSLAVLALMVPMQDAYAQRDIAEKNQQVIQLYQAGQKTEAIALAEQTVAIAKSRGDDKVTAILMSQLGNFYRDVGRFGDAENTLKTVVAMLERGGQGSNFALAQALNNLGGVYLNQNMFADAEKLFQRSLELYTKLPPGKEHNIWTGNGLNNLAVLHGMEANAKAENGQLEEANQAYDKMIAEITDVIPLWSKEFGPTHQNISVLYQNRGEAYAKRKQYDLAKADLRQALALRLKYLPPKHWVIATTQNSLANALVQERKFPEAEQLLQSALVIRTEALGPSHPSVARNLIALSQLSAASGNTAAAVDYSRKATAAVIEHARTETLAVRQQQGAGGLVEQSASYFIQHVDNLAAAQAASPAPQLGDEALQAAQSAVQSVTAGAVQQLGVRLAASGDAVAALVRESQDTSVQWRERDKALIAEVSKPTGQQNRAAIEALRRQIVQLEDKQKTLEARIDKDFPDYAALSNPKPLTVADAQKLLAADEGVVFFLPGDKASYVFALTHDAFEWHTIALSGKDLGEKVVAFRRGLDVDELDASIKAGKPVYFNLELAYELYSSLLGPVEATIKDKHNLAVVPSGVLTSLPFHLLVTGRPPAAPVEPNAQPAYRDAPWLFQRQAVSVLPSVASLKALRSAARADHGTRPFIGFGNPLFQNNAPAGNQRGMARNRGYNEFWTARGSVDRGRLVTLDPLPETAEEINDIADRLGAAPEDIHLGKDASETIVKQAQLSNYRVIYFATHGLVAGQITGIGEPALVLSIPPNPTAADDGLLTSSEVAELKLNADWVVLSACNTMAGNAPGADALSGLARAFFYAGSRALLVSHWAVASDAATQLTISTFDFLGKDPAIGRAGALSRAMNAYLNDAPDEKHANPAYWGPFSVVGEGAER
jgi:CHAT domain-containing protein/Tfp pilus assembly protein PilF